MPSDNDKSKESPSLPSAKALAVTSIELVSSLPSATSGIRGRMVLLTGTSGRADGIYVCLKLVNGTYDWVQII